MSFNTEQKPLRTWSHLAGNRRKPSEYDIVSKKLHYSTNNPNAPWELSPTAPMNMWYKKYRNECVLKNEDWDQFSDPDQLVYRTYNLMQDGQETHVLSLFDQFNEREHDLQLDKEWVDALERLYAPLRYLFHAVQMSSAYLGQMAPASTITNCATFQAADFLRMTTHTAYRTYELSKTYPENTFAKKERQSWQEDACFQPFRKLIEKQMVVYDWGEAFASLSIAVIPAISEGILKPLAAASRQYNDTLLPLLVDSQLKDLDRHIRWSTELIKFSKSHESSGIINEWAEQWVGLGESAIEGFVAAIPGAEINVEKAVENYRLVIQRMIAKS